MSICHSSQTHVLFTSADRDAPDCIRDRNGEVVLGLCKICGRGEIELREPCNWGGQHHPILSAAPSFDHLDPFIEDHVSQRARDQLARLPNDIAADRFARTPGPAELARQVADDRLDAGDRAFGAALVAILLITPAAMLIVSVMRLKGLC